MAIGPRAVEDMVKPAPAFWAGRRVLLTGHTGFKGGWLALWLAQMGARVHGLALPPATTPNLFAAARIDELVAGGFGDIRDAATGREAVRAADPEIVLHLAAQPLVHEGYRTPLDTFATNVLGTANVLDALRDSQARVALMVTTDKVYRNREWVHPYRESDRLGGHDPYSASKAAAEIAVDCWRDSYLAEHGVRVASARAGNVIGGGDWSADRLIPDAVRAWGQGTVLDVRRPEATRPWQHVIEPLGGYLVLAERLWDAPELAGAWNFGPEPAEAATVRTVIGHARGAFGRGETAFGDGTAGPHEAGWLALDTAKARRLLGVVPRWALEQTVARTMAWYCAFERGADARELCEADLESFGAAQ